MNNIHGQVSERKLHLHECNFIAEWLDNMEDEDFSPAEAIAGTKATVNPLPFGFLFVTKDNTVELLHSVGYVKLRNRFNNMHERYVGFLGKRVRQADGTIRLPAAMPVVVHSLFRWQHLTLAPKKSCRHAHKKNGTLLVDMPQRNL